MRKIIKTLLVVMVVVLALTAFVACGEECVHTGGTATCTEAAVCELCGESYGSPLGHTEAFVAAVQPTCTEGGISAKSYCSVCNTVFIDAIEIPALGHTMVDVAAKAPTCTEAGYTAHKACEVCDYVEGKEVLSAGHTLVDVAAKAPTCTEAGYTAHKACSACDYVEGKEVLSAGHTLVDVAGKAATCTEAGYTAHKVCSACDYVEGKEVLPAGHTLVDVAGKAATCTEAGYTAYKACSACDYVEGKTIIDALGHTDGNNDYECDVCHADLCTAHTPAEAVQENRVEATCTADGSYDEVVYCAKCHDTISRETKVITATGHTPGAAATCTTAQTCTVCSEVIVAALGHDMQDVAAKAATCTTAGYTAHTACSRCDHIEGKTIIDALGHDYENGTCNVCNTHIVYFVNTEKWTKVNAYMWDSANNGWPGAAMTKTGEQINGFDVYAIEYTAAYVNIIFNNGSTQTADLKIANGKYFCAFNSLWYNSLADIPSFEGVTKTTYYLPGGFNSWKDANVFLKEGTSTVIRSYVELPANQTYEFKVKTGSTWYGSTGTVSATSTTITFSSTGTNAKIKTACAGVYIFEYNTSTKKLTVIYPHTEEVVAGKDATCTETGLTEGKKCSVCGTVIVQQTVIPTVEHAWDDAEAIIRTCVDCGFVQNTHFAGGQGTAEDPYLISNAEQLSNISNYYGTYQYYKVADGVTTIDMTGVGKINLHGSFDGNGVELVNLTTALFERVGFENGNDTIKISNLVANLNNTDGRGLVRNIFNSGKTTFENVTLHGYVEGLYNLGSFYNYGTANFDKTGADYTVEFINSKSDLTIVCTSGNIAGGFLGHSYEGAGNSFTMIIDENSAFTGKICTTTGKGNLYFAMTSDYNNTNNHFIINGVETPFNNGQIPAAANLVKIAVVAPTFGEDGVLVAPVEGADHLIVYINAQVTAHNEDGTLIPNLNGMTWPLGNVKVTEGLDGVLFGLVNSASIVNGTDNEYGYTFEDGVLTLYSGRDENYASGKVYIQVSQYDAEGNLLATGTVTAYTIEHDHVWVGGDCTTDAECGCGAVKTAPGHTPGAEATCTTAQTCTVCSEVIVEALGHDYDEYVCTRCGQDDPDHYFVVSIPEALAAADGKKVEVSGTVSTINTAWSDSYGNITVTIVDANGNELYIYRMKTNVALGDIITVKGAMGTYNGRQIAAGSTATITGHDSSYDYTEMSIEDAIASEDGTNVIVTGTVVAINTAYSSSFNNISVTISDDNGTQLYIYRLSGGSDLAVNDIITVKGSMATYNGSKQVTGGTYETVGTHTCTNFTEATCTKLSACVVCGATTGELLEHNYVDGTCTGCGATQGVVLATESLSIIASKGTLSNKVITWTGESISFTNAQSSSTTAIRTSDTDHFRVYKDSEVTISGSKMTKVVITCTSSSYATACKNSIKTEGVTATVSGSTVTITVDSGTVDAFNFTAAAQWRLKSIEVTYQE